MGKQLDNIKFYKPKIIHLDLEERRGEDEQLAISIKLRNKKFGGYLPLIK